MPRRASTASWRSPSTTRPSAWKGLFPEQAALLQGKLPGIQGLPVVVGHSNGGIVAREWSKTRPMKGLLTLSSPNQGAPIANNAVAWGMYNASIVAGILNVQASFSDPNEGSFWILSVIQGALAFAADTVGTGVAALGDDRVRHLRTRVLPGQGRLAVHAEPELAPATWRARPLPSRTGSRLPPTCPTTTSAAPSARCRPTTPTIFAPRSGPPSARWTCGPEPSRRRACPATSSERSAC